MEKLTIEELKNKLNKDRGVEICPGFEIDRANINEENQIIPMSVSSDDPYKRWFGYETLDHSKKSIRLERFKTGAAFRDTHSGDQVGIVLNPKIDSKEKKLRIDVQFSKNDDRAVTLFKDIKDGIRKNISIRYEIHEIKLEKEVEGVSFYRVTDWEPIHAALEPDPADISVGVGRSSELEEENKELKNKLKILINNSTENKMEKEVITQEQLDKAVNDARKKGGEADALRSKNIYSAVNMFGDQVERSFDIYEEAVKAVGEGESSEVFSERVFQSIKTQKALQTEDAKIGLTDEEAKSFSISRAVNASITGNWDKAGFEKAASDAARAKQTTARGNFTIPPDVMANGQFGKRELVVGTDATGGYLVGTDHLGSSFIDVLRNKSVTAQANATILEGLIGNPAIPKKTAAGTAAWIATEGADAADTTMTLGQLTLSPKTLGARTSMTRQLLLQSNPSIDRLAENDLIESMAIAIDLAAIHGTGSSGQPTGVAAQSGIGDVTGSAFSFAKAVSFKTKIKVANAFTGNLFYITNPTIEGSLETTEKSSSTARYLLEDGKMAGYPVLSTNQISAQHLFLADWSQLVIAMWGGLDVIVDAISQDDGNVKIKVFQSIDIGIRYAGAFCMSDEVAFS